MMIIMYLIIKSNSNIRISEIKVSTEGFWKLKFLKIYGQYEYHYKISFP